MPVSGGPSATDLVDLAEPESAVAVIRAATHAVGTPRILVCNHARSGGGSSGAGWLFGLIAVVLYLMCPITGPKYAFGDNFPYAMRAAADYPMHAIAVAPFARNGMPSMHFALALLLGCAAIFILLRDPAVIGLDRASVAWPLISVAAMAIIGSAWLAFFNGRRLVRMLQELNHSTARISQGDYTQPVQTLRRDELGDLQRTVDQMRQSLSETTITKNYLHSVLNSMADAVFVARPGGKGEDDGWLVSYVYDRASEKSEMVVVDAKDFAGVRGLGVGAWLFNDRGLGGSLCRTLSTTMRGLPRNGSSPVSISNSTTPNE